jgi:hypothetical protein
MIKIRKRGGRVAATAILLLTAIGLSGCGSSQSSGLSPIQWYRDLSGTSVNDPKDKAPNEANLAAGSKEPYPNLASVPSVPDTAITAADRKKMAQSLIADRQNAQYTDQQLRAGQDLNAVAPPPVVAATPSATPQVAAAAPPATVSARKGPPPARPVAAPRGPVHEETLPTAASAPPPAAHAALPPAAPKSDMNAAAKKKDHGKNKQARTRAAEAPPRESSLRSPGIGNLPQGEEARAAPPPPVGSPAARHTHPEEVAAAAAPDRGDEEALRTQAVTGPVAQIKFAPPPYRARILPAGRRRLADVARMAQQQNIRIRVVGYGVAPSNANKQQREFQSFNAALDNAKAVGIELAKLGVPADRIDIETSTDVNAADHAEVFVEK